MKKVAIFQAIIFLIVSVFFTNAFAEEPKLTIDSGGHMAQVWDIMFTRNDRYLVSASADKTIRVWDADTGAVVRTLRGQIGEGPEGKIYAAALSHDDRILAVGGWMKEDEIRLIDFNTGEVLSLLKGHSNGTIALRFSSDSRLLLSGNFDKTVRIWDVQSGRNLHVLQGHKNYIYGIGFSPDDEKVVTGSYDKTVKLWDTRSGRLINTMTGHTDKVRSVAFTPDGRYILSGSFDKTIRLWRARTGTFIKQLASQSTTVYDFTISPDSRFVLTGSGSRSYISNIFSIPSGEKQLSFNEHSNTIPSTAIASDSKLVATGGGSDQEIFLWDGPTGKVRHRMVGKGRPVWGVGFTQDGRSIAWGNKFEQSSLFGRGSLKHSFILEEDGGFKPVMGEQLSSDTGFIRGLQTVGNLTIRTPNGRVHKTLEIVRNGVVENTIERSTLGDNHYSLSLTPDGRTIVAAGSWDLETYDSRTGKMIREYVGHTGVIWGVAVSRDGRYIVSGSDDQTIRLWDIDSGKNLLTIFRATDNQWVAWTPEGYYTSSSGGDKYIGWHINQGQDKSALFFSASRFADKFRSPLIVANYLKTDGNLDEAVRLTNLDSSRQGKVFEQVSIRDMQNFLPPAVFFQIPAELSVTTSKQNYCVKAGARSLNKEPITDIWFSLNGRKTRGVAVSGSSSADGAKKFISNRKASIEQCFKLTDLNNTISVVASNAQSQSEPETVQIRYTPSNQQNEDIFKPNLYILSIGVSEYTNSQFNLDVADADAKAVVKMFELQKGKLFKSVKTRLLINDEATKDDILDGLEWIDTEATQRDMSIIFIAGHGVNDPKKNYYFLPHDANIKKLRRTGVRWMEFQDTITSLPSKTILMVDTCHSGNITGKRRGINDMTEAIRVLNSSDSGVVVMAASTGREASQERPEWGHGAFTKALIEGIQHNQADYNRNGTVEIKELDLYITERVKELTGGSQHPTTEIPKILPNFPIAAK